MTEIFDPVTMNPTIIYLALLVGLWVAVTAAHVAGTGILEVIALVLLTGSIYGLVQMPTTNWVAVLLLVAGTGFFLIVPFVKPSLARWAELGLILQAAGGVFLFDDRMASPLMIVTTLVLAWLYNRFVLVPALVAHHKQGDYDEADNVIGMVGRVIKDINGTGTVLVNSEIWTARSTDFIPAETSVIVTAKQRLELVVEKAKREEPEFVTNGNGKH